MQDLGADMDDLLKRAAEAYPLKKDLDRWEQIAARLATTDQAQPSRSLVRRCLQRVLQFICLFCFMVPYLKLDSDRVANESKNTVKQNAFLETTATNSSTGPGRIVQTDQTFSRHFPGIVPEDGDSRQIEKSSHRRTKPEKNETAIRVGAIPFFRQYTAREPFMVDNFVINKKTTVAAGINSSENAKTAKINRHFFFGLTTAANLSTVKQTGGFRWGHSFGFLAGYRFSPALAIESGLVYTKKFYRSEGSYFDMKEMESSMPAGSSLMDLEGATQVLEIPFHLNYRLLSFQQRLVYAVTGFSSYRVTKEENSYQMMVNGAAQKMAGIYKKDRQYILSSLNLAVGYECKPDKLALRIQPYLQLPLKGAGVGKLPVTSFGLQLALHN